MLVCWYEDRWDSQKPVEIVADISGTSFAIAIVILSVGRVVMVTTRILKRKEKEEGRKEAMEEVLEAARDVRPGETPEQTLKRIWKERVGKP